MTPDAPYQLNGFTNCLIYLLEIYRLRFCTQASSYPLFTALGNYNYPWSNTSQSQSGFTSNKTSTEICIIITSPKKLLPVQLRHSAKVTAPGVRVMAGVRMMASGTTLGWGPTPEAPQVDSGFLVPQKLSGQKSGEDWKAFFVQHLEENQKKQEKESPVQQQSHESWEQAAKSHNLPGKSGTVMHFWDVVPFGQMLSLNGCIMCTQITDALKNCPCGQGLRPGLGQGWMWGSGLLDVKPGFRHALKTFIKAFGECISHFYDGLGRPAVTRQSAWEIYLQLLEMLQHADELPPQIELLDGEDEEVIPLLDNYEDLPAREESNDAYYMGGVNGGLGMDTGHHRQLDILEHDDEPELTGADDAGLVVSEFSDCEDDDSFTDEW
ncbi:hypothetical protein F4604DRAFT_1936424 [Suillus subluteus]|nr:hypothetical protein F4604DRAFT_1936424 [Suillus subluteus]